MKASPTLTLGWPPNLFTWEWVISAILLMKVMTLVWRTSALAVKFLTSQKPNMAQVRLPFMIGLSSPLLLIFLAMMAEPACPKPSARRRPIFMMAYSNVTVSRFIYCPSFPFLPVSSSWICVKAPFSSKFSFAAIKGFLAIILTLAIISSIGLSTIT